MRIQLYNFNPQFKDCTKLKLNSKDKDPQTFNTDLFDLNSSFALRNQILFCGRNKRLYNEYLLRRNEKTLGLGLNSTKLNLVLNVKNQSNQEFIKYAFVGEKASNLVIKTYLLKNYPDRNEKELLELEEKYFSDENKVKVLQSLFPDYSFEAHDVSNYNALMGLIVSNNDVGFKDLNDFILNNVVSFVMNNQEQLDKNSNEKIKAILEKYGKSDEDLYIQTRVYGNRQGCKVYYKDTLLSDISPLDYEENTNIKDIALLEAIKQIENSPVILDKATDNLPYTRFGFADSKRIKWLKLLEQKFEYKFNDINLLHRAFLYGLMPDMTVIQRKYSCKPLNYIGRAVYDYYCAKKLIDMPFKLNKKEMLSCYNMTTGTQKLAQLAQKARLEKFVLFGNFGISAKSLARLFLSVIGAIYLDDEKNGFANVSYLLDKNYKKDIFSQQFDSRIDLNPVSMSKIESFIEEYKLKVQPEAFKLLTKEHFFDTHKGREYIKIGKEFFNVYLRGLLYNSFPNKDECELTTICSIADYGRHIKIKEDVVKDIFDNKLFNLRDIGNRALFSNNFLNLFLGILIQNDKSSDYRNTLIFMDKYLKNIIEKSVEDVFGKSDSSLNKFEALDSIQKKNLEEFCRKYNIKFNDLNLLNKVFMFGILPNGQKVSHQNSFEVLEYVGDGVLGFCLKHILSKKESNIPKEEIYPRAQELACNKNLTKIAQQMNLIDYSICSLNADISEKFYADIFEALIGAIYLDNKNKGFVKVCEFLEANLIN